MSQIPKEIADKILNCKTYNTTEMQTLARAYLELEKEQARLILHIDDIEKCNDNCQAKIASLESKITKLKSKNAELEKKLQVTNNNWPHEKKLHDDFKSMSESFKQCKEENENLKLELTLGKSSLRCGQCGNIGMFHNGFAMDDELTKLKKSREGLRKALEFYGDNKNWCLSDWDNDKIVHTDVVRAPLESQRIAGIKAREALNADDELMK